MLWPPLAVYVLHVHSGAYDASSGQFHAAWHTKNKSMQLNLRREPLNFMPLGIRWQQQRDNSKTLYSSSCDPIVTSKRASGQNKQPLGYRPEQRKYRTKLAIRVGRSQRTCEGWCVSPCCVRQRREGTALRCGHRFEMCSNLLNERVMREII